MRARVVVALAALAGLGGCGGQPFTQPLVLGGVSVPAARLNHGFQVYRQYCRACHGDGGDGQGASAIGLRPPPRDFTLGLFKFGHVPAPALPPDAELGAIVRGGLGGTAMLAWDLPDGELDDVVQYLKTFSPRWRTEPVGRAVALTPDPFGAARADEAIALGAAVYHAKAQCSTCHPAYATHEELWRFARALTGSGPTAFNPEMYRAQPRETEFCLEWKPGAGDRECALPYRELPPDFVRDRLRTVRPPSALADLYRVIASGIGGAGMPTWQGALPERELWALAYYVRSLVMLRDTPAAAALRARLDDPANLAWTPPR